MTSAKMEELQRETDLAIGSYNSFEVSPNVLLIPPGGSGQLFVSFSPLSDLVGNYSGALKIKYFKKVMIY